ncbi:MAG: hypothetical protein KIT53_10845 [Hydrogenophaga sp.]|nr:hypothetical protein [Hydrogenophaga sp.]MCW5654231.1 hypothetical protein [Hydrogenophaga sp.]
MEISRRLVKAKNPCAQGFRWLLRHHPDGHDYQPLLDALVADGRVDDACWLLDQFGPTHAVLRLDRLAGEAIVFAGSLDVRGDIDVGTVLRVGRTLRAGGYVRVGGAARAGGDIVVDGGLETGSIEAGGDVHALRLDIEGAVRVEGQLRTTQDVVCQQDLDVRGRVAVGGALVSRGRVHCGRSLQVRGDLQADGDIRAGEGILVCGAVHAGAHLDAGQGIRAGDSIAAGGAIRAGESLASPETITAGPGYGVFAGLCVQQDEWPTSARVQARVKPEGLMSGWWESVQNAADGPALVRP